MDQDVRSARVQGLSRLFTEKVGGTPPNALLDAIASVRMGEPWCHFANSLLHDGSLSVRERELVILRIAGRRSAAYVVDGHRRLAAGALAPAELDRITSDDLSAWSPRERLLIAAADALDAGSLPASIRGALRRELGEEVLVEFGLLVGQYVLVSVVTTLLGLQPERPAA